MGLIPKKLSPNSTIGIVALSSSLLELEKIKIGSEYLEKLGYNIVLPKQIYQNIHFFPGTAQERGKALTDLFNDDSIDMIMALKGGFGGLQALPHIDYKIIKKNPKIFVGFSDVTSVQNAIYKETNLICFQGPMLTSNFAEANNYLEETSTSLFSLLNGERKELINNFNTLLNPKSSEKVTGTLLGGNFITFMTLMGTKYQPDLKNSILFFEDIDEKTYSIDRALSQLLLNDQIKEVKAFIFGDFNDCNRRNSYELDLDDLIKERLGHLKIPIVMGVRSGHCSPMISLPIGAEISINFDLNNITLIDQVVH